MATTTREPRVCALEGCEIEFTPKRDWQRYCSNSHRVQAHNKRRYITTDGRLTTEQMATVFCKYGHPGMRQKL